ncbi:MAG: hypothetical protein SCH71_07530 [Desulfobulbaceae bacterium]|nr:hypothetical protein [Desulfobulbaceae bacterium]
MNDLRKKRQVIRDLMEYSVPEGRIPEAADVLDIYREDRLALDLLEEFYSFLPDAVNDWIREIRLINRRQGIFLLDVVTEDREYVYTVSSEGVEFQGNLAEGIWDPDLLSFFGYNSREKFLQVCESSDEFVIYEPPGSDVNICPACHAATGELHELGCPIELCPWCGGQLVYCSCRFDQLEVDSLSSEQDLLRFEDILNSQGRIPYGPEQRPSFADEGPGLIIE